MSITSGLKAGACSLALFGPLALYISSYGLLIHFAYTFNEITVLP